MVIVISYIAPASTCGFKKDDGPGMCVCVRVCMYLGSINGACEKLFITLGLLGLLGLFRVIQGY